MKALLWKTYYKLTLKDKYSKNVETATSMVNGIIDSTNGQISHFYNDRGDKIRGWSSKRYRFANEKNPLVTRYGN